MVIPPKSSDFEFKVRQGLGMNTVADQLAEMSRNACRAEAR